MSTIFPAESPAKREILACQEKIAELTAYRIGKQNIGLSAETLAPDAFLSFFSARGLSFLYYVRGYGLSVGSASAYDLNIWTLEHYIDVVKANESRAVDATVTQLLALKEVGSSIGIHSETLQPDQFPGFFGLRGLPFAYYLRSPSLRLGNLNAYDLNIDVLHDYINSLSQPVNDQRYESSVIDFMPRRQLEQRAY